MDQSAERTEVVQGRDAVSGAVTSFFRNAQTRMDICTTNVNQGEGGWSAAVAEAYLGIKGRGGRLRMVTTIQPRNSKQCKEIAKVVELRHLDGIGGSFGVSDNEYMTNTGGSEVTSQLIYSNSPAFVKHHQAMFEMMWENGVPADQKIEEVEMGMSTSETRIIRETSEAAELAKDLIGTCTHEVLIVLASPAVVSRNSTDFKFLINKSKEKGFKIRILAPAGTDSPTKEIEGVQWRPIEGINAGIAIYDGSGALLTQYSKAEPESAAQVVSNIFTTNKEFVKGMIAVFEAMWNESELRQAEGRSRRMAEVAQDILAHDIRNYNQVAMLNAEALEERLEDAESRSLLATVLGAIRGSTNLIDRTRELGRIISQEEVKLFHYDLDSSFRRALTLIREANPDRELEVTPTRTGASVVADDLLDEVFVNILSNAVKYTDGKRVPIDVSVEEETDAESGTPAEYWRVTIADHGRGMPTSIQKEGFERYSPSDTGSGLGLSIVHALVVNRYSGILRFRDRVEGDLTKGTAVEICLPKA